MSYHKFPNLREIFQSDLTKKIMDGVESLDFKDRECNCSTLSKVNGECAYNGNCRKSIIVYKATCKLCDMAYIGNTQQTYKKRMQGHFQDVKKLFNKDIHSDSFARHFGHHFNYREGDKQEAPTPQKLREVLKFEVVWQGNPISIVKTFGKRTCLLCSVERMEIVKASKKNPKALINHNSEIYGACRHKPKFHRYKKEQQPDSTDDRNKRERVLQTPLSPDLSPDSPVVPELNSPEFEPLTGNYCKFICV